MPRGVHGVALARADDNRDPGIDTNVAVLLGLAEIAAANFNSRRVSRDPEPDRTTCGCPPESAVGIRARRWLRRYSTSFSVKAATSLVVLRLLWAWSG
jgi:hypothetical protein